MMKLAVVCMSILCLLASNISWAAKSQDTAEWTIMLYMNGDNNLEPDALLNFAQLARIGSSQKVHFVVQLDRIGKYVTDPEWSQTLRFHMQKGTEPLPKFALEDLGEQNMGSGEVLGQFVKWARQQYKAKHYMLVVWDHGQGWRNLDIGSSIKPAIVQRPVDSQRVVTPRNTPSAAGRSSSGAPYRSISNDETNSNDALYNREIHDALKKVLGKDKLDVIGFDACLMSMIETAYAMQDIADYMIGSEELEPGEGWNYEHWAQLIHSTVGPSPVQLAKLTVQSYESEYKDKAEMTLSAIDLKQVGALAKRIDSLARILKTEVARDISAIKNSRDAIYTYGEGNSFYHIDLGKFLQELSSRTQNLDLHRVTQAAHELLLSKVIIASHAGCKRQGAYGSSGLAIYFPSNLSEYTNDPYAEGGYTKSNSYYPVAFVQDNSWADFLFDYVNAVQ